MGPKRNIFFLLLIIIPGIFLRIIAAINNALWLDEANGIFIASQPLYQIKDYLRAEVNAPLFYYIMHFWIRLLGDTDFTVRYFPIIISSLNIILGFFVAKRLLGVGAGFVFAFLLTFSPFALHYSVEARMYSLALMWGLINLYSYWVLINNEGKHRSLYTILFIGSSLLGLATHHLFYSVMFSELVFFIADSVWFKKTQFRIKNSIFWVKIFAIIGFLYLPLFLYIDIHQIKMIRTTVFEYVSVFPQLDFASYFFEQLRQYLIFVPNTFVYTKSVFVSNLMTSISFLLLIFYLMNFRKNFDKFTLFLLVLLIVPNIFLYTKVRYNIASRYTLISAVALYLLFSKILTSGIKNVNLRKIAVTVFLFAVTAMGYSYTTYFRHTNDAYFRDEFSAYITRNEGENDGILLTDPFTKFVYKRYFRGKSQFIDFAPQISSDCHLTDIELEKTAGWLKHLEKENAKLLTKCIEKYDRVWLVNESGYVDNTLPFFEELNAVFPESKPIRYEDILILKKPPVRKTAIAMWLFSK